MDITGQRVLIIDDNPEFSRSLKLLIEEVAESSVALVECAYSIVDGIKSIRNKSFQYVFVNTDLPNHDGIMAIRLIHMAIPDTKIIACTFHKGMFHHFQVENAGAIKCIVKDEIDTNTLMEIFDFTVATQVGQQN